VQPLKRVVHSFLPSGALQSCSWLTDVLRIFDKWPDMGVVGIRNYVRCYTHDNNHGPFYKDPVLGLNMQFVQRVVGGGWRVAGGAEWRDGPRVLRLAIPRDPWVGTGKSVGWGKSVDWVENPSP
jgi:hypothetical protein